MTKGSGGNGSSGGRGSSGFGRKKKTSSVRPFKDFHADWIEALRSTLLPLLRHSGGASSSSGSGVVVSPLAGGGLISSSDLLSTHSAALHSHFQAYYHALDLAAGHDPSQLFAPLDWRSPIEKPFLWLGNFHPSLFTNLPRSLYSTSQTLIPKIEQLELGIHAASSSRPSSLGSAKPKHLLAPSPEMGETTMLPSKEEEVASPEGNRVHLLVLDVTVVAV